MRFTRFFVMVIALSYLVPFTSAEEVMTFEHGGVIQSVEFHPTDSSQIISAGDDNTIKLWNLRERVLTTFTGHTDKVNAVAFSPNGELLASGSDDKTFKLWSVSEQEHIATLEHISIRPHQHASTVTSVAFSPDGKTLATAGYRTLQLWDLSDNTVSHTFQHVGWVYAVVFSPDGKFLATVDGKQIRIWNVETKQHITQLEGDNVWIGDIAFSPDSQTFVGARWDGIITLWRVSDWTVYDSIRVHDSVSDLAFSPDGEVLASAGAAIDLWRVETGEKIASLTRQTNWILEVAFSPDGTTIASGGGNEGALHVQNVETLLDSQPERDIVGLVPFTFSEEVTTLEHGGVIQSVEFHPTDNSQFVSASDDHTIKLWNLRQRVLTTFTGHTDKVNAVAFSPNGELLVSGSDDKTFKLWSVPEQQHVATLEHIPIANQPASTVTSVAFSPDGDFLATAGYQTVKLWDLSNNTVSHTFQHIDWVSEVVFSPDGKFLATVDGKQMKIWNVETKQLTAQLEGDSNWIGAIAFSPDSQTFVGAGSEGITTLWRVSDWTVYSRIRVHGSVSDLVFSPDGKVLASAGAAIDFWSVETGEKIASLTRQTNWILEVAFSPDGTTIASGGGDEGALHVQNVKTLLDSQPERDFVRLVYFLPSDRTPQSDIDTKIETWIKGVQKFYADTMERHGYGRKTFTYETDNEGNAVVYHITGQFTDEHYNNNDKWRVWDEIRAAGFNTSQHIYAAFMDFSEILDGLHCGTGGNWGDYGGVVNLIAASECLDGDFGLWLAVHEFGHAFGLQHDYRNNSDLGIGEAEDPTVSSPCAAEWLDVHRYFNSGTPFYNEPTMIEMWPPRAVDSGSIRLRFTITDLDGLHQVQLLSTNLQEDYFAGRDYLEEQDYLDQGIVDCKSLTGSSTTAEFITTEFTAENDTVVLRFIDANGYFTEKRFPIDTTALSEYLEDVNGDGVVNIQDLVLVAANFGQTGQNVADVNEDGAVNIQDLVLVAGAFGKGAAAPSAWHHNLKNTPTQSEIWQWLRQARQMNLIDPDFQRGILVLEQLLAALTPKETALLPNYPNPFNPETWIPYRLAKPADTSISIYSVNGHLVRTLALGHQSVGIYESRSRAAYWDGKNALGESVASGVYFYVLTAGDFTATRKMLILK